MLALILALSLRDRRGSLGSKSSGLRDLRPASYRHIGYAEHQWRYAPGGRLRMPQCGRRSAGRAMVEHRARGWAEGGALLKGRVEHRARGRAEGRALIEGRAVVESSLRHEQAMDSSP